MKIAYYEQNNYHTEIMGTFLQLLFPNNEVTVYNTSDRSNTVYYFQKLQNFEIKPHNELSNDYQQYDKIIIGSSLNCDDFISKVADLDYNKLIFVCHSMHDIKSIYKNIIVLTPLNLLKDPSLNIKYILPIHNYITTYLPNKSNIFTIIGRFKDANRDTNNLINLINKYNQLDFVVHIFSRVQKFVPKILFDLSKIYPNRIKIFLKVSSDVMDNYLKKSKFILPLVNKNSWYHKDRLSGNIALAYNYNVPLIMDEKLQNIYQIKNCISYKNSLVEIIDQTFNMSPDTYQKLVNGFMEEKNEMIISNTKSMEHFLQ